MGSFVGKQNQYIQLVKVLYCKLPTIGKQLPTFPHKVWGFKFSLTHKLGWRLVVACPCQVNKFRAINLYKLVYIIIKSIFN